MSPAVSADGVVMIGGNDRSEGGVDVTIGAVHWTVARGDETYSFATVTAVAFAHDGDHTATLSVVDTRTGPALGGGGSLYIGSSKGTITAFAPS